MTALKEVVNVEKNIRSDAEILEMVYKENLYYPYTIKRLINSVYFKDFVKTISDKEINYLIYSLEQFCHCLHEFKEVNSFNLSDVAMYVVSQSEEIRDIIYNCIDKNKIKTKEKYNIIHSELKRVLSTLDIKEIDTDLELKGIFINPNSESTSLVVDNSKESIEEILLELIDKYDFAYSDILTYFILEVDINNLMKFRTIKSQDRMQINNHNFMILLNRLCNIIYLLQEIFGRDGIFLYRMLELYIFTKDELKSFVKDTILNAERDAKRCNYDLEKHFNESNKWFLLRGFTDGLIHIKEYYLLEFDQFSNVNMNNFKYLSRQQRFDYISEFCSNLEENSIYAIYNLHGIKDKDVIKYSDLLDRFIEDLKMKKSNVLIRKQELDDEQKKLITVIFSSLDKYREKYQISNICLSNLEKIGRIIDYLTFNLTIENDDFLIKISKNNTDIVWHVLYGTKKILREICICEQDVDRIYLLIQKYRKEIQLRKKHNLI